MQRALASRAPAAAPVATKAGARRPIRAAAPRIVAQAVKTSEAKTYVAQEIPGPMGDAINAVRFLSIDGVNAANSGHPGLPMGCAPMATVLFTKIFNADPADPKWADRDRFVLSAGHGSMLQYSLLHLMGYKGMQVRVGVGRREWGGRERANCRRG